jgi:fumarate hydratase subunit alpha
MRIVDAQVLADAVFSLFLKANCSLPPDVHAVFSRSRDAETERLPLSILERLIENAKIAEQDEIPICQDTGMASVFIEIGEEVHISGSVHDAVNEGTRRACLEGFLRPSIVGDPLKRINTGDNTEAMLALDIVPGCEVRVTVLPKGAGSENMSAIAMLSPGGGAPEVERFVLETVKKAGANPCPPVVVGVGLGGSFDKAALLAKKAHLRPIGEPHPDPYYAELEARLLERINAEGCGPQGFGGRTTAFAVAIEKMHTHIACLPCAVNINCHAVRRMSVVL